jgi:hypothetical protein
MRYEEQVGILIKAVRGALEDRELTKAERDSVLRETFDDYARRTGRNGLEDIRETRKFEKAIAGVPVARTAAQVLNSLDDDTIHALVEEIRRDDPYLDDADLVRLLVQRVESPSFRGDVAAARRASDHSPDLDEPIGKADTQHALAMAVLEGKGAQIRKRQPNLTEAQSVAQAIRENPDVFKMERAANLARFAEHASAQYGETVKNIAIAKRDSAHGSLMEKAAEIRRAFPALSQEQSYARAYADPANRQLVKAMHEASRAALYAA